MSSFCTSGPVSLSNMLIESPAGNNIVAHEVPSLTVTATRSSATRPGQRRRHRGGRSTAPTGNVFTHPASFNIADNTMKGFEQNVMNLQFADPGAANTVTGHITGNTVGNGTAAGQATAGSLSDGIGITSEGNAGIVTVDVSNNTINGIQQGNGFNAAAVDGQFGASQAPTLNLTLANNAIDLESQKAIDGINVGSGSAGGAATVCLNATGNSSVSKGLGSQNGQFDADGMYVNNADNTSIFALVATGVRTRMRARVVARPTDVEDTLNTNNPGLARGPPADSQPSIALQFGTAPFTKTASCPTAPAAASQASVRTQSLASGGAGKATGHAITRARCRPREGAPAPHRKAPCQPRRDQAAPGGVAAPAHAAAPAQRAVRSPPPSEAPLGSGADVSEQYLSEVRIFSFGYPPRGWAQCNGQILAIAQNQALFALLGTQYGGNGTNNFALPNLQGRVPMHFGQNDPEGSISGSESHTLSPPRWRRTPIRLWAPQPPPTRRPPPATSSRAAPRSTPPLPATASCCQTPRSRRWEADSPMRTGSPTSC